MGLLRAQKKITQTTIVKIFIGVILVLASNIFFVPVMMEKYPKASLVFGFILLLLGTFLIFVV